MTRPTGPQVESSNIAKRRAQKKCRKKHSILISIIKFSRGENKRQPDSTEKVILNIHYNNLQAGISQRKSWHLVFSGLFSQRQPENRRARQSDRKSAPIIQGTFTLPRRRRGKSLPQREGRGPAHILYAGKHIELQFCASKLTCCHYIKRDEN